MASLIERTTVRFLGHKGKSSFVACVSIEVSQLGRKS